jgi:polyisoprenoid-binding protein YceI
MPAEKWEFDLVHSSINFWVRHLMVSKVHGRFGKWSGSLAFDEKDPSTASVEVTIDAGTIETKEAQRDEHLRSADFLDAKNHPSITFKSTSVAKVSSGNYKVAGNLTIRGTQRPVTLDVEYAGRQKDPWGGERVGFSARTSIDRRDFALTWNKTIETGGVVVGDKVEIQIEIEAVLAKATAAKTAGEARA